MIENPIILLLGIGNCGRADDGLGWAFLDHIKGQLPENYDVEYRYQLQIEDAELITNYDKVIFIDAHKRSFQKGYVWEECLPLATDSFTTHQLDPRTVLFLAESVYNKRIEAYSLGINGENYCLSIGLTNKASLNLTKALSFFEKEMRLTKLKTFC